MVHLVWEAARLIHEHGTLFHCGATQAIGKIPFATNDTEADMVTLSSHKIYGLEGCGAPAVSRKAKRRLAPTLRGGSQERCMRNGTPNVLAIARFGEACRIAVADGLADASHQRHLCDTFEHML